MTASPVTLITLDPMTLRTLLVGALALGLAACSDSDSADVSTAGPAVDETALTFADAPGLEAGTYSIDPAHSRAEFRVRHLGISTVTGRFDDVTGTVVVGDGLGSLDVTTQIDAGSINTGNEQRDGHLRSGDFFDVANYPDITFEATEVRPAADGGFVLVGDLTMRGVTNPVELEGEYLGASSANGVDKVGFTARGEITRQDWGLTWAGTNDAGEALVGDEVELVIEVEADRQAEAAPEA